MNQSVNIQSVHVDWLAFVIHIKSKPVTLQHMAQMAQPFLNSIYGAFYEEIFVNSEWSHMPGRRPYQNLMRISEWGINLFWGGHEHVLVEIQGKGCAKLAHEGILMSVAAQAQMTVNRIDIAVDVAGTNAALLAASCANGRIKSRSTFETQSGATHYLGSRTSDSFCRCYEYNEPHERAGVPRVEYVARGAQARAAIDVWLANGIGDVAQAMNNKFKIEALPDVGSYDETLPSPERDRSSDKTMFWLRTQVAPAIRRMVDEGHIDNPIEWFRTEILGESS